MQELSECCRDLKQFEPPESASILQTSSSLCACCPSVTGGELSRPTGGQGAHIAAFQPCYSGASLGPQNCHFNTVLHRCDMFSLPSCPSPSAPFTDTEENIQNRSMMGRHSKDLSVSESTSLEFTALALSSTLAPAIPVTQGNPSSLSLSFLTGDMKGWDRYSGS